MIGFNLLVLLISLFIIATSKPTYKTLLIMTSLFFLGGILIYLIPIGVIIDNINIKSVYDVSISGLYIFMLMLCMDKIRRTEIGNDINEFSTTILPNINYQIIGLFFISQIIFFNSFLISFILTFTIGSLMKLPRKINFITTFIGVTIANVVYLIPFLFELNYLTFEQIDYINDINLIIANSLYVLAFIFIIILISTLEHEHNRILDVLAKYYKVMFIIFFSFLMVNTLLSSVIKINASTLIASLFSIIVTSIFANKNKNLSVNYDTTKFHPYVSSILIVISLILSVVLSGIASVLGCFILIVMYIFMYNKYDDLIFANPKRTLKLLSTYILLVATTVLIGNMIYISNVNNYLFGTNLVDFYSQSISVANNAYLVLIDVLSFINYLPIFDVFSVVSQLSSLEYAINVIYFTGLLVGFNVFILYASIIFSNVKSKDITGIIVICGMFSILACHIVMILVYLIKGA